MHPLRHLCLLTMVATAAALLLGGSLRSVEAAPAPPAAPAMADAVPAAQEPSPPARPRPARRMRASLSMPYFSFAQSLTSRS